MANLAVGDFVPFYPKKAKGRGRERHLVRARDIVRDASGAVHEVVTFTGTVLRYKSVPCNLSGCYCDAQLVQK